MRRSTAATLLCFTLMLSGASAAQEADQLVLASQSADISITYDGVEQAFTDVNGTTVLPILYGGTTYLPVRAVSGLAGLDVSWDQDAYTVSLSSGGTQRTYPGMPAGATAQINASLSPSLSVTLDGLAQSFTDVNGNTVFPLLYAGTTYLPVRAVCSLTGIPVDWDEGSNTVKLGTKVGTAELAAPVTLTQALFDSSRGIVANADGSFSCVNDGSSIVGPRIYLTATGQHRYLSVEFTAGSTEQNLAVYDTSRRPNVDLGTATVPAGEAYTLTADISGRSEVCVAVWGNEYPDSTISKIYYHN